MASLGTESTEENSLSSKMVKSGADENSPLAWSDYDTAGIGEKPSAGEGLASRDRKDKTGQDNTTGEESPTTRPSGRGGPGDARPGDEGRDETGTRTMTRDQAIQRMTEMLRRMATERKKR